AADNWFFAANRRCTQSAASSAALKPSISRSNSARKLADRVTIGHADNALKAAILTLSLYFPCYGCTSDKLDWQFLPELADLRPGIGFQIFFRVENGELVADRGARQRLPCNRHGNWRASTRTCRTAGDSRV